MEYLETACIMVLIAMLCIMMLVVLRVLGELSYENKNFQEKKVQRRKKSKINIENAILIIFIVGMLLRIGYYL